MSNDLQQIKLEALRKAQLAVLQQALGNYDNFRYVNFNNFIDPDNSDWYSYAYQPPGMYFEKRRLDTGSPEAIFIQHIRDAKTIDDAKKQQELWNLYKPLDTPSGGRDYVRYFTTGGYQGSNAPYGGSRPVFPTTNESDPVQTTAGGTQGAQTSTQTGNVVAKSTQTGNGTYATAGVAKGGTKTIGYDPNPGNISLAYAMRNAPEQERRAALIDKWNREHGRESVSLNRSSSTYASPSISNGGTYATGQGIKDANGNVLTNPGGDWEYQYALKDPQYGLGMMGKMSDAQKNYLQAVSDNMGYKYNFTGATRFV